MTRAAWRIIAWLVWASTSSWVVRPPPALIPSTHGHLDLQSGQRLFGEPPDYLVGLRARDASGHDDLQARSHGEVGGDVERVGDDDEVDAVGDQPGDRAGRGPTSEPQCEWPVRQQSRGAGSDPLLLLAVLTSAVADGQLVGHVLGERSTVSTAKQLLVFKHLQVAPQSRRRHAEGGG